MTTQLVVISGLSGAGKTVALKQYEDLGYFCIDNLPLDLVEPLLAHALASDEPRYLRVAVGVDARAARREIAEFPRYLDSLRAKGVDARVLFLQASEDVLLRRYNETRRRHPLAGPATSLIEAIRQERQLMVPIANLADLSLDTSRMNLHELRAAILAHLGNPIEAKLAVQIQSFGYKNGIPLGVDFIFDARCIANPHWIAELRPLTGLDKPVADYLEAQPDTSEWLADLRDYLLRWLPRFQAQDRAYLTVALGCTGGQHRSVYLAEKLAETLRPRFGDVIVKHRDLPV